MRYPARHVRRLGTGSSRVPEPKVVRWIDAIEEGKLFLSVLTLGALEKGIAKLPDSPRRNLLREVARTGPERALCPAHPVGRWRRGRGLGEDAGGGGKRRERNCRSSTRCWRRPRRFTILPWPRATWPISNGAALLFSIRGRGEGGR